jgi:hypothetical protein
MRSFKVLVLTLVAAVPVFAAEEPTRAAATPLAVMHITPDTVTWEAEAPGDLELTVAGPDGAVVRRQFAAGEAPTFALYGEDGQRLPDGVYTYELRAVRELRPRRSLLLSGSVEVRDGSFVEPEARETSEEGGLRAAFEADQVISDDLIVDGRACIGEECVDGDNITTLKLKAPDVRIVFDDTPDGWSPSHDWMIEINDGLVGSHERFSILSAGEPGSTPFTIRGGAPDHSLYVTSTGNIGLGTSTPGAKLHLYGTATSDVLGSAGPDPSAGPAFNFGYGGASFGRGAGLLNARPDASATAPNPSLRFLTANVQRMIITNTGNVGIGTSTPGATLEVASGEIRIPGGTASASGSPTHFRWFADGKNYIRGTTLMADDGGSVGIGTVSPASKLHVNGGDIRVSGGSFIDDGVTLFAPDYVFEPDYELMPLDEQAAFVRAEKHLPNVPNAAEIRASGLNLSQFQMRLLEKIEELTLYTLAQQEQIAALAAKVEALEAK